MYRIYIPCTLDCTQVSKANLVSADFDMSDDAAMHSVLDYSGLEKSPYLKSTNLFNNRTLNPTTNTSARYYSDHVNCQGSYSESDGATIYAGVNNLFIYKLISNNQNFKQNLNCTTEIDTIHYQISDRVIKQ